MYPHSPHVTEHDEPTMADLRGVLPGQRPPVDATVLDEPTSEVPMIRPPGARGGTDAGPELERTIKARPTSFGTEPAADPEPEAVADAEDEPEAAAVEVEPEAVDVEPEAVEAEPAIETAEPDPEAVVSEVTDPETGPYAESAALTEADTNTNTNTEPTAEAETEMEAETVVETTPEFPQPSAPVVEHGWAPTPATTPPVVAAFAATPEAADTTTASPGFGRSSEMAKMSWDPPPPPPGLTNASAADLAEPEAVAEPEVPEVPEALEAPEPEPAPAPAPAAPRRPGEVAETPIALWTDDAADRLRDQWRDLQVEFFDDPNAAVTGAKNLVTSAVHELADTLLAAQDELDPFHETDQVDTESMRVAMRRYREFLDRVLAL